MLKKVLIVGLGQIGMGYDLALRDPLHVLSHARAFSLHPDFELIGGVEPRPEQAQAFSAHYHRPAFSTLEAAFAQLAPEIVVVATPTYSHAEVIRQILSLAPPEQIKVILAEKPLAYDLAEAENLVNLCQEKNCLLFVNYLRRAEPGVREVWRRIQAEVMQGPFKGVVWYSKGMFNCASHYLNLLGYWLGKMTHYDLIQAGRDWHEQDPEPDFRIGFERGEMVFLAAKGENFFHHSLEWVAANGRLRYEQGGAQILWQPVEEHSTYAGYQTLAAQAEVIPSDFARMQWYVADQLAAGLAGKEVALSSGRDALKTLKTLVKIKEKR
jgi:predicted dehydrogenase